MPCFDRRKVINRRAIRTVKPFGQARFWIWPNGVSGAELGPAHHRVNRPSRGKFAAHDVNFADSYGAGEVILLLHEGSRELIHRLVTADAPERDVRRELALLAAIAA
jgi:hypothetical protein